MLDESQVPVGVDPDDYAAAQAAAAAQAPAAQSAPSPATVSAPPGVSADDLAAAQAAAAQPPAAPAPPVDDGGVKDTKPVLPAPAGPAAPSRNLGQDITGGLDSLYRGTGLGDELMAGSQGLLKTGMDILGGKDPLAGAKPGDVGDRLHAVEGQNFRSALATQRADEASFAAAHPYLHGLLSGTGMAIPTLATMGDSLAAQGEGLFSGLVGKSSLPDAMARGAVSASAGGAAGAAEDSGTLTERLNRASKAVLDPLTLLVGAATGGLGAPTGKVAKTAKGADLADSLKSQASDLYKSLDNAGGVFRSDALSQLGRDIYEAVSPANRPGGVHQATSPNAYAVLHSDVMPTLTSGKPMSMSALDELYGIVRDATTGYSSGVTPRDNKLGYDMMGKISSFIKDAGPHNFAAPIQPPWEPGASERFAQNLQMTLAQAKNLWGRSKNVQNITDRVESAIGQAATTDSGANVANKIRQKLYPLLDPMKPGQNMSGLSPAQQAQLVSTTQPSKLEDSLRTAGKMDPLRGGLSSWGALMAIVSHPQLIPVAAAASLARNVGDSVIKKNVDKLTTMIATGDAPTGRLAAQQLRTMAAQDPRVAAYVQQQQSAVASGVGFGRGVSQGQSPSASLAIPSLGPLSQRQRLLQAGRGRFGG